MEKTTQFYADGLVTVSIESKNGSLFHYTKTMDSLCKILETGFRFSYCFEEQDESIAKILKQSSTQPMELVGSTPIKFQDGIAMPMICFCDIPISKALNHRQQYGNYCIGLDKEKCRKALPALNPILYMSSNWVKDVIKSFVNALPTSGELNYYKEKIQEITSKAENTIEAAGMISKATVQGVLSDNIKYNTRFISTILELLSIVKPYESNNKCFYNEHEWRVYYTPVGYAKAATTAQARTHPTYYPRGGLHINSCWCYPIISLRCGCCVRRSTEREHRGKGTWQLKQKIKRKSKKNYFQ